VSEDEEQTPLTWRTIFWVRNSFDGLCVEHAVSYDKADEIVEFIKAQQVAQRMTGEPPNFGDITKRFPEAVEAVNTVVSYNLRGRYNNDIRGPFNVLADHALSDEEMIAWFQATQTSR
jgi:hypothetical protein